MFIFTFLDGLVSNFRATSFQKILFKKINVGDLVWAKMPLGKKELKNIEKSHWVRPYLVVSKDKYNIWGYASSSSSRQNKGFNNYEEYCIPKTRYKQNKNSWLSLITLYKIPIYNIRSKHQTLSEFDLKNIQKRLKLCNNRKIDLSLDNYFAVGDVVNSDNQLFYVYSADNVFLYTFSIFKHSSSNKNFTKIIVNHKTYYANFKNFHYFKRIEKLYIENISYRNEINTIANQLKQFKYENRKLYSTKT